MKTALVLIIVLIAAGCLAATEPPTVGIYGNVTVKKGNCLPIVREVHKSCIIEPLPTKVYFRAPMLSGDNKTEMINRTKSSKTGFYSEELLPGNYSVFVDNLGEDYCNKIGEHGELCQVEVKNESVRFDIEVDRAVW